MPSTGSAVTGGTDGGAPYYGRARIAGGLALIFAAITLLVVDALSRDYSVDSIVLGLVLGTGIVLLGVEAGRKLIPPGGP
jgi:hypothetical protein